MIKAEGKKAGATIRLKCDCTSPYQDRMYGKGVRIHNLRAAGSGKTDPKEAICTVCGRIKDKP